MLLTVRCLYRAESVGQAFHDYHHEYSVLRVGNILYNATIVTAITDRLVENSEIFLLGGDSLRKANKNPNPPAE